MAKQLDIKTNKILEPVDLNQPLNAPNPEVYYRSAQNALAFFTSENAPTTYEGLKKEVKALEKIHSQSFIILAHRLKLIRDQELYRADNYEDFKSFIENELDLARRMVYNYIEVLEVFGVQSIAHDAKISSLVIASPYAKAYPEDKKELLEIAKMKSTRDLKYYLKEHYSTSTKEEDLKKNETEDENWFLSREELLSHSTFLRDGMKPKTTTKMLKELINLKMLEEPKNKELVKIKQILSKL